MQCIELSIDFVHMIPYSKFVTYIFKKIVVFLSAVLTVYFLAVSSLYFFQEKLLFVPDKLDPSYSFRLPRVQEEKVPVEGGFLNALHFKNENPKGLVFFLHGNAGSLATWLTDTSFYEKVNYDLFMIDYRGYGKSEGTIQSEEEFFNDARHAFEYIAPSYTGKKIVVYGRSLGTAPATYLSRECKPDATILVSPFYNLNSMREQYYSWAPKFAMRYSFDNAKHIANIKNKILILHGDHDELIPLDQARKLQVENPKSELVVVPYASHNDIHNYPAYHERLTQFLNDL